jgi:hypothetical protein
LRSYQKLILGREKRQTDTTSRRDCVKGDGENRCCRFRTYISWSIYHRSFKQLFLSHAHLQSSTIMSSKSIKAYCPLSSLWSIVKGLSLLGTHHLCFYLFYLVMMSGVAYCFYNVFICHHYASIFLHLCIIAVSIPHVLPLISKWSTCLFKREVNVIFKRAKALFMSFLSFCIGISR